MNENINTRTLSSLVLLSRRPVACVPGDLDRYLDIIACHWCTGSNQPRSKGGEGFLSSGVFTYARFAWSRPRRSCPYSKGSSTSKVIPLISEIEIRITQLGSRGRSFWVRALLRPSCRLHCHQVTHCRNLSLPTPGSLLMTLENGMTNLIGRTVLHKYSEK